MTDKLMTYYSVTPIPHTFAPGESVLPAYPILFFPTERKLEIWKRKNPDLNKEATWQKHEISVSCAKDLIKLSKKKPKEKCSECGK